MTQFFTRPFPALVLQATNTGVRRPGLGTRLHFSYSLGMRRGKARGMTTSENVMHSTDEPVTLSEDIRPEKEREGTLVPSFGRNIALNLYV